MNLKRILCLVLTAPAWLAVSAFGVGICVVVFSFMILVSLVEYGFVWPPNLFKRGRF